MGMELELQLEKLLGLEWVRSLLLEILEKIELHGVADAMLKQNRTESHHFLLPYNVSKYPIMLRDMKNFESHTGIELVLRYFALPGRALLTICVFTAVVLLSHFLWTRY
ncbi:hypothetical protein KIN20_022688 [Parelaphostrongylus tenuis]|uniref:Uncharacterized protein n=1 Tax=Parelaphostrongylus tenuis TaxID=148309 RepID=A0AAD5MQI7_PARTN|nr:hypothetical protein KIN20_022688 [Parelaphostrongylus tenuis]